MTGTPLGPGGEFDMIREMLSRWGSLARGIGDDAALVDVPSGSRLVVSTDTSVENVHFRRASLSPEEIAYRAVAAAMSDLAAMAATPLGIIIALTLTDAWRAAVPALADGIAAASRELGAPILGGDVTRGGELAIAVTVLGSVEHPLLRSGARAGDTLWVTGHLGGTLRAFRALESGKIPAPAHRAKFAHPVPRLHEARWLAARNATAAIDCSDGIAADASHLAAASGVRVVLDLDRLPLAEGATPQDAATSGEEYELIVTAPATLDRAAFEREFGIPVTAVGRVEAMESGAAGVETYSGGARVPLPRGHSHFSG
ncbi:MAG TPA: thiamine-phosphate kinase [Gemmatimonadaceae bacterium]